MNTKRFSRDVKAKERIMRGEHITVMMHGIQLLHLFKKASNCQK
jgi:hypothetical protein